MQMLTNDDVPRSSDVLETQYLQPAETEAQGEAAPEEEDEEQPLLYVDINLGGAEQERIVIYEGDTAPDLAAKFCEQHGLDEDTRDKLEQLLEQQMASVLQYIDEEDSNESNDE